MKSLNHVTNFPKTTPLEEKILSFGFNDFIKRYYALISENQSHVCIAVNNILKNLEAKGHVELGKKDNGIYCIIKVSPLLGEDINQEVKDIINKKIAKVGHIEEHEDVILAESYLMKRKNAVGRGIDFKLSFPDYKRLKKKKTCHYTGISFSKEKHSDFQQTIDRKDSNIGYTKENCVVCCLLVNRLKENLTEGERKTKLTNSQMKRMLISFAELL